MKFIIEITLFIKNKLKKKIDSLFSLFFTSNAKAINNESVGERIKREKQAKELRMQIKDDFILKHELEQRCYE